MRPGRKGPGYAGAIFGAISWWWGFNEAGAQRPRILSGPILDGFALGVASMRPGRKGPGYRAATLAVLGAATELQ